jgi:hypothetical protein
MELKEIINFRRLTNSYYALVNRDRLNSKRTWLILSVPILFVAAIAIGLIPLYFIPLYINAGKMN